MAHKCTLNDMDWSNEPIVDSGECVSFKVTCKVCGKVYEEVYSKNDGLFDPDTEEYVRIGVD